MCESTGYSPDETLIRRGRCYIASACIAKLQGVPNEHRQPSISRLEDSCDWLIWVEAHLQHMITMLLNGYTDDDNLRVIIGMVEKLRANQSEREKTYFDGKERSEQIDGVKASILFFNLLAAMESNAKHLLTGKRVSDDWLKALKFILNADRANESFATNNPSLFAPYSLLKYVLPVDRR